MSRMPHPSDDELADTLDHVRGIRRRAVERSEQRQRMAFAANYAHAPADLLDSPEAQPVIARVGAACALMSDDIDRVAYVRGIVLDVMAAKARPRCPQRYSSGATGNDLGGRSAGGARKEGTA